MPLRNTEEYTTTTLFNGDVRITRINRKQIFRSSHAFYTRKSTQSYKKSFNYQNYMKKNNHEINALHTRSRAIKYMFGTI